MHINSIMRFMRKRTRYVHTNSMTMHAPFIKGGNVYAI